MKIQGNKTINALVLYSNIRSTKNFKTMLRARLLVDASLRLLVLHKSLLRLRLFYYTMYKHRRKIDRNKYERALSTLARLGKHFSHSFKKKIARRMFGSLRSHRKIGSIGRFVHFLSRPKYRPLPWWKKKGKRLSFIARKVRKKLLPILGTKRRHRARYMYLPITHQIRAAKRFFFEKIFDLPFSEVREFYLDHKKYIHTVEDLFYVFDLRLDYFLTRFLPYSNTIKELRQYVRNGNVKINEREMRDPTYIVSIGDIISISEPNSVDNLLCNRMIISHRAIVRYKIFQRCLRYSRSLREDFIGNYYLIILMCFRKFGIHQLRTKNYNRIIPNPFFLEQFKMFSRFNVYTSINPIPDKYYFMYRNEIDNLFYRMLYKIPSALSTNIRVTLPNRWEFYKMIENFFKISASEEYRLFRDADRKLRKMPSEAESRGHIEEAAATRINIESDYFKSYLRSNFVHQTGFRIKYLERRVVPSLKKYTHFPWVPKRYLYSSLSRMYKIPRFKFDTYKLSEMMRTFPVLDINVIITMNKRLYPILELVAFHRTLQLNSIPLSPYFIVREGFLLYYRRFDRSVIAGTDFRFPELNVEEMDILKKLY